MELDEFKPYWKTIQDKEFTQQKLTTEKLDQIIMETAHTLDQLQRKSAYWIQTNTNNVRRLRAMLIPFLLIICVKAFIVASETESVAAFLTYTATLLIYMAVILIHYFTTVWVFKKQQTLFTLNNTENLKETLRKTIDDFKGYYIRFNIIYLLLYPVYFYSVIKLITFWQPMTNILLLTCALLTIVALALGHLLYKKTYGEKIKALKANLKELEEDM